MTMIQPSVRDSGTKPVNWTGTQNRIYCVLGLFHILFHVTHAWLEVSFRATFKTSRSQKKFFNSTYT